MSSASSFTPEGLIAESEIQGRMSRLAGRWSRGLPRWSRRLRTRQPVLVMLVTLVVLAAIGTGIYYLTGGRDHGLEEEQAFPELFPIGVLGDDGYQWGYIDAAGTVVVEPQFRSAASFSEGLGLVRIQEVGTRYGYVDADGSLVIEPRFTAANDFSGGLALVVENGIWTYIDPAGGIVFNLPELVDARSFSEGLALVALWDGAATFWGYIDTTGKIAIAPQFGAADHFSEGLAAVQTLQGWGYIDRTGDMIIRPRFGYAGPFSEGLAAVWVLGEGSSPRYGYIDKTGTMVIAAEFPSTGGFHEGFAAVFVSEEGGYGYVDRSGEMVIEPRFHGALEFSQGLAAVELEGAWGYVDTIGEFVIQPHYDWAESFSPAGLARVGASSVTAETSSPGVDGRYIQASAYIDMDGDIVWHAAGR